MSSKPKAELEQALNSYLSNRSPENIVASANSTRKIVDPVRGAVAGPRSFTESAAGKDLTEMPSTQLSLKSLSGLKPYETWRSAAIHSLWKTRLEWLTS